MVEELAAFGALCLIALLFYFVVSGMDAKDKKDKDNIDLSKHLDGTIHTVNPIDSYEGKKELRKILSDPEVRKKAEEKRAAYIEEKQKEDDLKRKDTIIKRTFSYKYENVIYEIFAPFAYKVQYDYKGQYWHVNEVLSKDYVLSEICRILAITNEKATQLLSCFIENDMISDCLCEKGMCELGPLLEYQWDIISPQDMSLTKWIEQHPKSKPNNTVEESIENTWESYGESYSLKDIWGEQYPDKDLYGEIDGNVAEIVAIELANGENALRIEIPFKDGTTYQLKLANMHDYAEGDKVIISTIKGQEFHKAGCDPILRYSGELLLS